MKLNERSYHVFLCKKRRNGRYTSMERFICHRVEILLTVKMIPVTLSMGSCELECESKMAALRETIGESRTTASLLQTCSEGPPLSRVTDETQRETFRE